MLLRRGGNRRTAGHSGKAETVFEIAVETLVGFGFARRLRLQPGQKSGLGQLSRHARNRRFSRRTSEFRPAPLADIASLYNIAWRWVRADYSDETHLFTVFKFGGGNFSYINPQREWQQAGTSFGKIIFASDGFIKSLEREKITDIPAAPALKDVARFGFFEKKTDRQCGVWRVRQGKFQFALPITTGTKPAIADYLPAPYDLPGFAATDEEVHPSLVQFIELADGKT